MLRFGQRYAVKIDNVRDASRQSARRVYHLRGDDGSNEACKQ